MVKQLKNVKYKLQCRDVVTDSSYVRWPVSYRIDLFRFNQTVIITSIISYSCWPLLAFFLPSIFFHTVWREYFHKGIIFGGVAMQFGCNMNFDLMNIGRCRTCCFTYSPLLRFFPAFLYLCLHSSLPTRIVGFAPKLYDEIYAPTNVVLHIELNGSQDFNKCFRMGYHGWYLTHIHIHMCGS